MTKETTPIQAHRSPEASSPDEGRALGTDPADPQVEVIPAISQCTTIEGLLQVLLEQAGSIYPCLNWLFGEIPDEDNPVEVEILAYSPTRLQSVYQGMRIPILQSPFSQRLYEEDRKSVV